MNFVPVYWLIPGDPKFKEQITLSLQTNHNVQLSVGEIQYRHVKQAVEKLQHIFDLSGPSTVALIHGLFPLIHKNGNHNENNVKNVDHGTFFKHLLSKSNDIKSNRKIRLINRFGKSYTF